MPYRIPARNEAAAWAEREVEAFGAAVRRGQRRARWAGCIATLAVCGAAAALLAQGVDAHSAPPLSPAPSYWARVPPTTCFCACGQTECDSRMADELIECVGTQCFTTWRDARCETRPAVRACK